MPVIDAIEDRQEQVLTTIEETQGRVLDANRKVAAATEKLSTSKLPLDKLPLDKLSSLPLPKIPAPKVDLSDVPKPADMVENYFGFVSKWTALNHKFAKQMIDVWTPETTTTPAPAKKAAVKKTTAKKKPAAAKKATAKKAPAKKPAAKS